MSAATLAIAMPSSIEARPRGFTNLPMEIQLQILKYCLLTEHAILDFGSGPENLAWESDARPQEDLALNIIFTCHVYHDEGWKIFFQQNKFKYTSLTSLYFSVDGLKGLPMSMFGLHHIALCLREENHSGLVDNFTTILEACDFFKSLEILHIHIERVHDTIGSRTSFSSLTAYGLASMVAEACDLYTWGTEDITFKKEWVRPRSGLYTKLREMSRSSLALQDPPASVGKVKEIVITGLPGDE